MGDLRCLHADEHLPSFSLLTQESVRLVWIHSKKGAQFNRCAVSIHPYGFCLYEEIAAGTYKSAWSHAIEDISYCVAEPYHRRIFAWIARIKNTNLLECHAVLCKTSKRARLIAELLANTFYESYRYRQQEILASMAHPMTRCSVCDTIVRQRQPLTSRSDLFPTCSRLHPCEDNIVDDDDIDDDDDNQQEGVNDYERISFHIPIMTRSPARIHEDNSIHSRSRQSANYESTVAEEESMKPVEYYRR